MVAPPETSRNEASVNDPLPTEVRQFIAQQIESVAQLEALLLLRRDPQKGWSSDELSRQLYLSDNMCQSMLDDLERRRYVARDADGKTFRYAAANPQNDALLGLLAGLYAERRVAVISEIYSNPLTKVKTFADAFRLRKDEPS